MAFGLLSFFQVVFGGLPILIHTHGMNCPKLQVDPVDVPSKRVLGSADVRSFGRSRHPGGESPQRLQSLQRRIKCCDMV